MDLRLRFGWAELIVSTDVQQQWTRKVLRFVETLLDTDAVVTDRAVRLEPHRQQIREITAHAKTDRPRAPAARGMLAQKVERGRGVCDGFCLVDSLIEIKRLLPVVAFVS